MTEVPHEEKSLEEIFGYEVDPSKFLKRLRPELSDRGISFYQHAANSYNSIHHSVSEAGSLHIPRFQEAHRQLGKVLDAQLLPRETAQTADFSDLNRDLAEVLAYWTKERGDMLKDMGFSEEQASEVELTNMELEAEDA